MTSRSLSPGEALLHGIPKVKIKALPGAVVTKSLQRFPTYKVDADVASSAEQ